MKRTGTWALVLGLVAMLATPALAGREDRETLTELSESGCSLSQAIENALAEVPGAVPKARLKRSWKPGSEPVLFYKVVVVDESQEREVLRFDARSCEGIEPTPPSVSALDAIATALLEAGGGFPVGSRLRFPGLEPVYKVVLLLPKGRLVVFVDGQTGEVLGARKWRRKVDQADDAEDEESEDDPL